VNNILTYFDLDHLLAMMQNSSHFEKTLSRSYSNYLAQINIELTQSSNRINDTAGRLTVLATFLVPMNLITGIV
jgi:magnesium transporter